MVHQRRRQIADRLDIVGLITQRRAIGLDRFVRLALSSQQVAEVIAGSNHLGLKANRQLIMTPRRRRIAGRQHQSQVVMRRGEGRIQPQRLFIAGPRVGQSSQRSKHLAQIVVINGLAALDGDGLLDLVDRQFVSPGLIGEQAQQSAMRRHCADRSPAPADTVARPGATARSDAVASRCVMESAADAIAIARKLGEECPVKPRQTGG